jgi:hypothetical protein
VETDLSCREMCAKIVGDALLPERRNAHGTVPLGRGSAGGSWFLVQPPVVKRYTRLTIKKANFSGIGFIHLQLPRQNPF